MTIQRFEDIIAWQKSQQLAKYLYAQFARHRDFTFRDQILRAVVSISNNIAEGFDRQTNKELRQFLMIAKGSCAEVRSMLYLARDLNYLEKKEFTEMCGLSNEVSKMLTVFTRKLS